MYERMRDNPQIVYRISGYIPYRPVPQQSPLSITAVGDSSTSASLDSHLFQAVYTTPNSFSCNVDTKSYLVHDMNCEDQGLEQVIHTHRTSRRGKD